MIFRQKEKFKIKKKERGKCPETYFELKRVIESKIKVLTTEDKTCNTKSQYLSTPIL